MPNAYADLTAIKSAAVLDIAGTLYDSRLLDVLEDVSRWIDLHCGRHFYVLLTTRTFDSEGGADLVVPDLISVTSLKSDDDLDRTFETTWAASDYLLYPLNAEPTQPWGRPYTRLVVDVESGSKSQFGAGMRAVQVDGKWGYREELVTSSATVSIAFDATTTTVTVSDGAQLSAGQTILIDAEQMYVTSIAANDLTVVRGVNGTVAASHAGQAAIKVFRYPAGIVEACLIQSARLWKRKDTAFMSGPGLPRSDAAGGVAGLDPDVRRMLSPYQRLAVGSGV